MAIKNLELRARIVVATTGGFKARARLVEEKEGLDPVGSVEREALLLRLRGALELARPGFLNFGFRSGAGSLRGR